MQGGNILFKRKWLSFLLLFMIFLVGTIPAEASTGEVIYYQSESTPVAPGISYEKIWQFTPAGWLKVHILRADLSARDVHADLLLSSGGLAKGETLSSMARNAGAVAGINADFFFGRGFGTPLGPVVREGELLTSPSARSDLMGFGLRQDGSAVLGRFSFAGQVVAADGSCSPLAAWNKPGESYREIYAYDKHWGEFTPQVPLPDALAAVVTDGIVTALEPAGNGVAIPAGSTVLVGAGPAAAFLAEHLVPGSAVQVIVSTNPTWQDLLWAVGGGTVLVKDGRIVPFTHEVKGNSPRSAVGLSQDGQELLLVAVDGRQEESRGLTQAEFASLLLDLGVYQALNLDGGGSTAVVARRPGESEAQLVNTPSEGVERSVGNGIGLFSSAPQGELSGLVLSAADTSVVLRGSRKVTVKGFDENFNAVPVNLEDVEWQVEPTGLGTVRDGVFSARRSGEGKIIAQVGRVKGELKITVVGAAERLELNPAKISLAPGESRDITVYARDEQGFKAQLEPEDVSWRVLGPVGEIKAGRLYAGSQPGTGALEARFGSARARALVSIGVGETPLLYFELTDGISFISHPSSGVGGIALATFPEPFHGHNYSLRLDYDFTVGAGTRAAYVVFDQGLALPSTAEKLRLWVYGDGQGHWLRGLVADQSGKEFPVDFARNVDWTGWELVEAKLPQGEGPLVLKRIYLVEPDETKKTVGSIYLDDLSVTSPLPFATELAQPDEPWPDPNYTRKAAAGSSRFIVTAALPGDAGSVEWSTNLKNAVRKNKVKFVVSLSPLSPESRAAWEEVLAVPVRTAGEFNSWDLGNTVFLSLNAAQGTLVQGDSEQWHALTAELTSLKNSQELFVFLESAPFSGAGGFSSRPEADLLRQRLSETRARLRKDPGVWVLTPSAAATLEFENGVRYQTLARAQDEDKPALLLFTLGSSKITYTEIEY